MWFPLQSEEKAMAPHSSTLAWKKEEEPGRLQSMGSLRVRHNWAASLSLFTFMHWRRKWQPAPVFLPGESQGQRSLVGCCLWGHTESDMTEATWQQQQQPTSYFTHGSVYILMLLSHFTSPSPSPHPCPHVLYICISIPALQIGLSLPFF